MTETVLDRAHGAMAEAPEDDALRLRFYERLADAELFVLLDAEAEGDRVVPRVFALEDGPVVLAFDRADRLAEFAQGPASTAEMTGRTLAPMLAEARLGLGLNLGVAPSEILLPAEAMAWLAGMLAARPEARDGVPDAVHAPAAAPEALIRALDAKLGGLAGLAARAVLVEAVYAGGERGLVLAFLGARPGAEGVLARAAGEALIFSGLETAAMDVTFLEDGADEAGPLERVGLTFDLPAAPEPVLPRAPGTDPAVPPRLR